MAIKRCALCKKAAYSASHTVSRQAWLCSDCRQRVDSIFEAGIVDGETAISSELCCRCRKRFSDCRFTPEERKRITSCSDWEGKNLAHDRRRWAKFESSQD